MKSDLHGTIGFTYQTYTRVRAAVWYGIPLISMTALYCIIAVILLRQDKTLRCETTHRNDQRRHQAIKMSLCVVAAFYICTLAMLSLFVVTGYKIPVSCLFFKVLMFFPSLMLNMSSTINPIICIAFVKSYRRGLTEIFNSCRKKRQTTRTAIITNHRDGISLQRIRITPQM